MRTPTILIHAGHCHIDERDAAVVLSQREGGAVNNNIAECSEFWKDTMDILGQLWADGHEEAVISTIKRHSLKGQG